jgi:hypothetical protein
MITVIKFASGSCDSTNTFGHASVVFTGLGHKESFAISQMREPGKSPTWHNSSELVKGSKAPEGSRNYSKPVKDWRSNFFQKRVGKSFPKVVDKAYIVSNEDLRMLSYSRLPRRGGMSEDAAFNWWRKQIGETADMSSALGGADCTKVVVEALKVCGSTKYTSSLRADLTWTPSSSVSYARAINDELLKDLEELGVTADEIETLRDSDKIWRLSKKTYLPLVEGVFDAKVKPPQDNKGKPPQEDKVQLLAKTE